MRILRHQNSDSTATRSGLTLIDMLVTVMIIGIMAAVATPSFTGFYRSQQALMAAHRVVADMSLIRSWAVSNSKAVSVTFAPGLNSYQTDAGGPPHPNRPDQVLLTDLSAQPYHSSIDSVNFADSVVLTFSGAGIPEAAGTIVVGSGEDRVTVAINPVTGKASIQ